MNSKVIRTGAVLAVAGSVALFGAVSVGAHDGATGVVKERMELMKEMGKSMKSISAMVRGKAAYDEAALRRAARVIADHGGERLTALFPEGSMHGPSEATSEIWQNWKQFSSHAQELRANALALAEAERDGQGAAFRSLGRTCGGCHRTFRKEKER